MGHRGQEPVPGIQSTGHFHIFEITVPLCAGNNHVLFIKMLGQEGELKEITSSNPLIPIDQIIKEPKEPAILSGKVPYV